MVAKPANFEEGNFTIFPEENQFAFRKKGRKLKGDFGFFYRFIKELLVKIYWLQLTNWFKFHNWTSDHFENGQIGILLL